MLFGRWPAHFGGAIEKLHFVKVRGGEQEVLCGEGWVPGHTGGHSALLNALRAQDQQLILDFAVLQVILYLGNHHTKAKLSKVSQHV